MLRVFSKRLVSSTDPDIVAERSHLCKRMLSVAKEFGADDLVKFIHWLRQERRGYLASVDGASPAMSLLDDIDALEAECKAPAESVSA
jgi:hypothetical protein